MQDAIVRERTPSADYHRSVDCRGLLEMIEHAAHLLPSQGPLQVFVHHNTLHAFEHLPFAEAVERGLKTYGCQPYLSEERYREELSRGRIGHDDLVAVLQDDLGERADAFIGLLGTRFHLRLAMLRHPLHSGPSAELRWVVAETDALRTFRDDMPVERRRRMIAMTRRWIMRDFRNGLAAGSSADDPLELRNDILELIGAFPIDIEQWSDADWESLCLQLLWRVCYAGVQRAQCPPLEAERPVRHRDALLAATGHDSDELVHDVLIRLCSAVLDQGYAHWPLPNRERGFYEAFIAIYSESGGVLPHWLVGLTQELRRLSEGSISALQSIDESLSLLDVQEQHREEFITSTLLALSGWAGMIWQMETNAEWAVRPAPRGAIVDFLAVRLLLDRFAISSIAHDHLDFRGPLKDVRKVALERSSHRTPTGNTQRAFLLLQLTQVLGVAPEELYRLPPATWKRLASEVDGFSELERRRVFHLAYERRYRNQTLDAFAVHARRKLPPRATPSFQVLCCIDDREESFRRHLEEVQPACETLAYAGFYSVAMYYRGAGDAHSRPLCPVVIKPKHYVEERPVYSFEGAHRRRARTRHWLGAASHEFHRGSRSLLGGAITALVGSLASAPLVARILFPRTAARIRGFFGQIVRPPAATQLLLERSEPEPGPEPGHIGYTVPEMADIVERTLREIGLTSSFAPLLVFCGHGSSSLNNPHESAYNCGACSGGRGGPNARAFAQMANDPRVRAILETRGLSLPSTTAFVGAFHNTCSDLIEYFDLDRLPATHVSKFETARASIDEARRRNAHERCRRFESVQLSITPAAALAHVEQRAEDLSQARPEYNHATNAVCYVGRRSRMRGLFMDRRAFMSSYDPAQDDENYSILARVMAPAVPVCAGISLEYYFSCVDVQGYGSGSKLPHNITSLLGVMEGAASDLRTGLSAQMTEIHEPLRNLFVVECTPDAMMRVIQGNPLIARLCQNEWIQLATLDPAQPIIHLYRDGRFERYYPENAELPHVKSSLEWYRGWRDHLGYAVIDQQGANDGDALGTSAAIGAK